jgi:hypothetical protein
MGLRLGLMMGLRLGLMMGLRLELRLGLMMVLIWTRLLGLTAQAMPIKVLQIHYGRYTNKQ